ncbi:Yip1 family protein [Bacillus sp. CGMCC 1.60114]|uniref:Yip1 family protein n=1 Tax=unclassified Bacillus (in: firmicutes) TaxID=185979 RepID=UPI0036269362
METNLALEKTQIKKPSLFGIIASPTVQFEKMKEKAPIGMPLVLMLLLMTVTGALGSYVGSNDPILKSADIKIPIAFTVGMGAVGGLFGGAIMFFLTAAFYRICMVFMGNDTPYKKLLVIVIYSSIISSLGMLVNALIALALGGYEPTYTSLAPLMANNPTLHAIAQSFDIFKIWYYVVLALGLHIVAGLSKNKAITLVVIIFLIGIGFSSLSGFVPQPGM